MSRWFSGLVGGLLVAACSELPPVPIPPAPAPPPAPVASVIVSPGAPSILVGNTVQLSAATKDAQGNALSGRAIIWGSSAEATATVSATGLVTGVSVGGPVTITATSEGQLGTAQVVVTAPPLPGYSLSLSAPTLHIPPGSSSPLSTLYLLRTSFTGDVTLSVDSLPTGVTAVFYPVNPASGSSSQFWLSVAPNAVPGTYPNLLVRGVASGLADRTAPLTLTITVAPIILTWSAPTLSIAKGGAPGTTTVNVVRSNFTGSVRLWVDIGDFHGTMPPGVTAAFAPNPVSGNSSVLTLTAGAAAVPGVYTLWVFGEALTGWVEGEALTLTVTAASP